MTSCWRRQVGAASLTLALLPAFITLGRSSDPAVADMPSVGPHGFFTDVSQKLGLDFVHEPGVEGGYFMPESLAGGGAFLDYDGDGDLDVYLINGAYRDSAKRRARPLRNRLFQQQSDGTFRDVTETAGIGNEGFGMGVAVGDMDNDGDPDVYVTNFGPDALYRNNGDGTLRSARSSRRAALSPSAPWTTTGTWTCSW
jgi:enediyne biosynthesis protein E4